MSQMEYCLGIFKQPPTDDVTVKFHIDQKINVKRLRQKNKIRQTVIFPRGPQSWISTRDLKESLKFEYWDHHKY